jgi:hypothetical protein
MPADKYTADIFFGIIKYTVITIADKLSVYTLFDN